MDPLAWTVFWIALGTAFATGLGALPFIFLRNMSERWQGIMSAVAGGMMISASVFSLADEALDRGSPGMVTLGMLAGAIFFFITAKRMERYDWHIGNLSAADSRKAILVIVTMFIHSIPEGIAIGVGYATGEMKFGLLLAIAIAVHNIPEGTAIALPLRAKGISVWACFWYAVLTSLPQPLAAVPSYLFVKEFHALLPAGLGFAGGAMLYLVTYELIPESLEHSSQHDTAWGVLAGLVIMLWITASLRM